MLGVLLTGGFSCISATGLLITRHDVTCRLLEFVSIDVEKHTVRDVLVLWASTALATL